ncbi:LYR motif-containing protein [Aspergillus undulatus]|uniref:LYR motif-containing protein n=1 Tax=Aspergillus undulatus TaxID=1810928 RepID=UPI003CCCCA5C
MHRVVVPKSSSVHRFACLALYRVLLRRCNDLQRTAPQLASAQSHIEERFRRYKGLQSPSQTTNALKAGYEALDLLNSASQGNANDTSLVTTILSEARSVKQRKTEVQNILAQGRPAKELSKKQIKAQKNQELQKATDKRHPDATSILSRPRPVVSGRRQVPALVNASGIPFLRIKKPQPKNLSRFIRLKIKRRQELLDRQKRLETELLFGQDEDEWDSLTTGQEDHNWASAVDTALCDLKDIMANDGRKRMGNAEKMWEIVLAERRLAEEENLARKKKLEEEQQKSAAT